MTKQKLPTPEETRDRLLAGITEILEGGDPYAAPEVLLPRRRSQLYAMMLEEFDTFAAFHGDVLVKALEAAGLPRTAGAEELLGKIRYLAAKDGAQR